MVLNIEALVYKSSVAQRSDLDPKFSNFSDRSSDYLKKKKNTGRFSSHKIIQLEWNHFHIVLRDMKGPRQKLITEPVPETRFLFIHYTQSKWEQVKMYLFICIGARKKLNQNNY